MSVVYVDTSTIVAIALGESTATHVASQLTKAGQLISSNLLEAEFRSAMVRENADVSADQLLCAINWVHPNRPLANEMKLALVHGYLRGADLWHVATALFFAPCASDIGFATRDRRQAEVAENLGFKIIA